MAGGLTDVAWSWAAGDSDGLVRAIEEVARNRSVDLAGVVTPAEPQPYAGAHIASPRGDIYVSADPAQRSFFLYLSAPSHPWASGATAELPQVVEVADTWRRGARLAEVGARFPFLEYTRLAQAFEDGNDLDVWWEEVLESHDQSRIKTLLLAVRASGRPARWYPFVTHHTFVRLMQRYSDKSADQVFLELRDDDTYETSASWTDERRTGLTVAEAVAEADAMMARRLSGGRQPG